MKLKRARIVAAGRVDGSPTHPFTDQESPGARGVSQSDTPHQVASLLIGEQERGPCAEVPMDLNELVGRRLVKAYFAGPHLAQRGIHRGEGSNPNLPVHGSGVIRCLRRVAE